MVQKVFQLQCKCNEYPWGQQGSKSLAARLCSATPGTDFKIDESKKYSEMWMGTYPELPSYVLETGEDLQDVLDKHAEELIGRNVMEKFNHTKLPFLPKVLSIAKALPLQLHPNKLLASELHKRDPSQFTDPNHKPEIALALGDFEAFCGFKPLATIQNLLNLGPLKQFLPSLSDDSFDDQTLKHVVRSMLLASPSTIASVNKALLDLPRSAFGANGAYIQDLIPRLSAQYDEDDNGIVVALVTMNYLQLKAGDSIYIPADGIHAYLSGDIIECMARSDNVLNTGFCPRADRNSVDMFCSVLTFSPHSARESILEPEYPAKKGIYGKTKLYAPPLSEFNLLATELDPGEDEEIEGLDGPSIVIATQGAGLLCAGGKDLEIKEGYVFFIGKGEKVLYRGRQGGLQVFTAFVE